MTTWDEFVGEAYDALAYEAGEDGIKRSDALELIVERVRCAIEAGLLEPPDGVTAAVDRSMRNTDTRRRGELPEAILFAAAAWNDETVLGRDDPSLRQAFAVGDIRKSLQFCTIRDLDEMVTTRRKNVTNAVASYEKFASGIDDLKVTMRAMRARTVGDLFHS